MTDPSLSRTLHSAAFPSFFFETRQDETGGHFPNGETVTRLLVSGPVVWENPEFIYDILPFICIVFVLIFTTHGMSLNADALPT